MDEAAAAAQTTAFPSADVADIGGTEAQVASIIEGLNAYLFEAGGAPYLEADATAAPTLVFTTTIMYPDDTSIDRRSEIQLDLRSIKAFYERRSIEVNQAESQQVDFASFDDAPFTDDKLTTLHSAQVVGLPFFNSAENVVLVHGWNMDGTEGHDTKAAQSEPAYKRLYWQGFAGKFTAFDWPTDFDAEGPLWPELLNLTYNQSEYQALRSGRVLKNYLKTLRDNNPLGNRGEGIHLLAHSMGNVVVAEALRLWHQEDAKSFIDPLIETYVAMEGAISAGAYGNDAQDARLVEPPPGVVGFQWDTDLYRYWSTKGAIDDDAEWYMFGTEGTVNRWVNMYNPADVATSFAWTANNVLKGLNLIIPGPTLWPYRYFEDSVLQPLGDNEYVRVDLALSELAQLEDGLFDLSESGLLEQTLPGEHAYEIVAFLSQSNSAVIGTKIVDWFDVNIDINEFGLPEPDGLRANHSYQYHHDASTTWQFWNRIKRETRFSAP